MRERLFSIDFIRGVVMCLMVLDHTRDFFGECSIDALDIDHTSYPLFFTRWITHFCAPTSILLAGMSVPFSQAKPQPRPIMNLALRGVWLAALEQTFVHVFGWYFQIDYRYVTVEVLWATGWSMVILACFLATKIPSWAIGLTGLLIEICQPWLDPLLPNNEVWTVLLRCEDWEWSPGWHFYVAYPILPWFGVLAIGYALGSFLHHRLAQGKAWQPHLTRLGIIAYLAFFALRFTNFHGDPSIWSPHDRYGYVFLSFINTTKYPPSLDYLLMTLSPVFMLLPAVERSKSWMEKVACPLVTLGRVPLFFYIAHIFVVHLLALVVAIIRYGHAEWLYTGPGVNWSEDLPGHPADYGLSLPWVYFIWISVILMLYPACAWFEGFKKMHPNRWLRYM